MRVLARRDVEKKPGMAESPPKLGAAALGMTLRRLCFPPRFIGFALLIEWLVFHSFASYGPSRRALVGATLKLNASVLFCVQPLSGAPSANPDLILSLSRRLP